MIERLANVLYWIGCGAAALVVGLAVVMAIVSPPEAVFFLIAGAIAGALAWLLGRAARYVLAGR